VSRRPIRDAVSAGGVIARANPDGEPSVVLCGRRSERLWGLPKGMPDAGEDLLQAALREVREETGLDVEPLEKLGTIDYWFVQDGFRIHKVVHHWLMRATGGDTSLHDHEYDDVEWLPLDEAMNRISYANERKILAEAARRLGVTA
jgi:8-oxo-dGTP pyrophosphatase MutT (NUDIX family)